MWECHQVGNPSNQAAGGIGPIRLKQVSSLWGEDDDDDGIDTFDFTLPGDVTQYVISVSFDEDGDVEDIVMES